MLTIYEFDIRKLRLARGNKRVDALPLPDSSRLHGIKTRHLSRSKRSTATQTLRVLAMTISIFRLCPASYRVDDGQFAPPPQKIPGV